MYRRRRSTRARVSRKPRRTSRLRSAIKAEIHRNIENKNIVRFFNNMGVKMPVETNVADPLQGKPSWYTNIVPNIPQGTGQGQRVGNVVNLRSANLKIQFAARPNYPDENLNTLIGPWELLFLIVKSKRDNSTDVDDVPWDRLFQFGSGSVGATNSMTDKFLDINKDLFTLKYKRVIKLGTSGFFGLGTTPHHHSNNDYPFSKTLNVNVGKMLKKRIQYNDTGTAINDNLWAFAFVYSATNDYTSLPTTAIPEFSQVPVECHYCEKWIYEDA